MIGVVPFDKALAMAINSGLDLVEISPGAEPPVCKVLDFGKYKYEAKKRAHEAKKKQKTFSLKEVKLRPNIGLADFEVKLKNIIKFLNDGDKVKVTLMFRGREIVHNKIAKEHFDKIIASIDEIGKVESEPKLEGRQMLMILSPEKGA